LSPSRSLAAFCLCLAFLTFSAPASASPVRCGDVITQDTRLDSDLVNCAGDGIVIGADGVTLDLNGHSIRGRGGGTGVSASGRRNVAVVDGAIRGFPVAVAFSEIDGGAVHEIAARGIVSCVSSAGCVIERTIVEGAGIFVIRARGGSPSVVRRNLVSGATGAGITVNFTAAETSVARNVVEGNGSGIEAFHSSVEQISDNTISHNAGSGISAARGGDTTIRRNLVVGNGGDGIELDHFDDVRVFANLVTHSGESGIHGLTLSRPLVRDNVVSRNRGSGIFLDGIAPDHESTSLAVLSGNVAVRNLIDGIALTAATRDSSLEGNRSRRNGDDGFDVDAASTILTENSARRNGDLGIEAVAGVANGGENWARRNGDRAQCRNLRCH
jgi:parallel beta-helix repeat protein